MDLLERGLPAAGEHRAQPLSRRDAGASKISTRWRRCRSFCRCAPRSAPRSRRRGWSAPSRRSTPKIARVGAAPISISRCGRSRRRRRTSSPSAAFPAPARRGLRARWRRISRRCPAPSWCAPTSSARRCSAPARPKSCRPAPTAPEVTARVYAALADKARRIVAAGHSAIVDAVFAQPQERAASAAAAKAAKVPLHGLFLTADLATRIARVGGRATAMPPTPTPRWPQRRKATTSARSTGRKSTLPARRRKPWAAPELRCRRPATGIARLTRPRRCRHKRPDAPPSGLGAAIKDSPKGKLHPRQRTRPWRAVHRRRQVSNTRKTRRAATSSISRPPPWARSAPPRRWSR